jgi:FeS assembly SUF system protein
MSHLPLTDQVLDALKKVYDPEIPVNIVELGLIYDCEVAPAEGGSQVNIRMTLTAPGCGMSGWLKEQVEQRVREVPGVKAANVELVWDPPWDKSRLSEAARLQLGLY